jgi:hypothetical protein
MTETLIKREVLMSFYSADHNGIEAWLGYRNQTWDCEDIITKGEADQAMQEFASHAAQAIVLALSGRCEEDRFEPDPDRIQILCGCGWGNLLYEIREGDQPQCPQCGHLFPPYEKEEMKNE